MRIAASNDIAGSSDEKARIINARLQFGKAVRKSFTRHATPLRERPGAVVIRHRPQRDADNTWRTWINAMCSAGGTDQEHWAAGAPLAGWRPAAIASVLDTCIDSPVFYELRA